MRKAKAALSLRALLLFISGALFTSSALAEQELSLHSKALGETREFVVHLPQNYDAESQGGYPVLYVLDPDFPEDKALQVDDIAAQTVPGAIVVGIRNIRRSVDFLPHYYSATIRGEKVDGNGGHLLTFIKDELIPYIGENFNSNGRRAFLGHSWAGQFVAYTLSQTPETFDAFIITSPAMDGRFGEKTFDALKAIAKQNLDFPDFVYVSVGGAEETGLLEAYENLSAVLDEHLPKGVIVQHEVNEGLNHDNNGQISQPKALESYFASAPVATAADTAVSFWDMPYLEKPFIDTTPMARDDDIPVGTLGVDGGDKQAVLKLAREIADKNHGLFDSLLIAQNGKLLFESYYLRGRVDLPHMQASTTKAYLGLAIGRAIQLGHLTMADLDKPLISFLDDLDPSKFTDGAEKITLHHAMTMRSGLQLSREQLRAFNDAPDQLKGQGQVQVYLEHSQPISKETQTFDYKSTDPRLVMQVLDAVVPGTAKDFIKDELLDKLGITNYGWEEDASGLPMGPFGSQMTSRNMVKWGNLVRNKGEWSGEQLISKEFIEKATNRIVRPSAEDAFFVGNNVSNPGYGYYWWQADVKAGGKSYFTTSAQGGGGNYIILIEELDLMIVTTAHDRNEAMMQFTADRILPAFAQQ